MIEGKVIRPAGSGRKDSYDNVSSGKLSNKLHELRGFFHLAPAAITGNSGKVMDHYMKFHKEHCGD
jgi:hypothetical protein